MTGSYSHITSRIIAGDIPSFGYMVIGAGVRSEAWTRPRGRYLYSVLQLISADVRNPGEEKRGMGRRLLAACQSSF